MRRLLAHKIRLRPSILTLFVLLTVPVFFAIVAVTYFSNDTIARTNAAELVERFRSDAIGNVKSAFEPIRSLVRSAAAVGNQQPDFYSDNRSLKYLYSILLHSRRLISAYVGLADGSFRQARRINPAVAIQDQLPPAGTQYAYRWIEPPNGAQPVDHYLFLDDNQRELGRSDQATTYDPRPRFWYRKTAQAGGVYVTEPDVFAALGLVGFTVAAPFYTADGKLLGVAGADITLDGLSDFLSEHKISPGTLSYILDSEGGVLANSEREKTYTSDDGRVALRHITSLDNGLAGIAFSRRPRDAEKLYTFTAGDREYIASYSTLPVQFGKGWKLFIVTPLRDFTSGFVANNDRLLVFGVVAIVVQILIIYLLSAVISAPLEKLALKVGKLQDLEAETLPPLQSPIREISVLSKAIDTLDATIHSFAAFVPVGLVKQLLESDNKLERGGHSRFLTIFFSDLEAFSTLSESVPSQELLVRVSAYFEAVTKVVNEEAGTIDKFIGDGVMAFWGAPALLEDHAWRACIAALRIEWQMRLLNAQWQSQDLPPLNIRIGIHSDAVLVGNIGSRERMAYTVIGDGVNVASRLEGINKEYGTRLCISHNVFKETGERLCVRPIEDVAVKGRRGKIAIYELMGAYGADPQFEPTPEMVRLAAMSRRAYDALIHEDAALALERYREILAHYPDDPVAAAFVRRLAVTDGPRMIPRQVSG